MKRADIRRLAAVDDRARLYVLGPIDQRLTVKAQQIRALNLAYALSALGEGLHVGIVGAGPGGVLLAAGVLRWGGRVTILEREPEPLHRMAAAIHRLLHPGILDWPASDSLALRAGLPMFDWVADDAATITRRWRAELSEYRQFFGEKFTLICNAHDVDPHPVGRSVEVTFNEPSRANRRVHVDVCVVCVGYGTDRPVGSSRHIAASYWEPDGLDRLSTDVRDVLVIGTGDGGLTDLFRVLLRDFNLAEVLENVLDPHLTDHQRAELEKIERSVSKDKSIRRMRKFYEQLYIPPAIELLGERVTPGRRVVLSGLDGSMFSPNSSCANRLLLSQLRYVDGAFSYRRGRFDGHVEVGDRLAVHIDRRQEFDRVVPRLGPTGGLSAEYPEISSTIDRAIVGMRRAHARIDPLRIPRWPTGFFEEDGLQLLDERVAKAIEASTQQLQAR